MVVGQSGHNYFARVTGKGVDTYVSRRPPVVDMSYAQLGNRCPYPISKAWQRLRNG